MRVKTETVSVNLATGERRSETVGDGETVTKSERGERVICSCCKAQHTRYSLVPGKPYTCMFCRYPHLSR
jgi:hypothetical protein